MIINWKIKKNCSPNLLVTTINLRKEISSWQKCELYVVGNLGKMRIQVELIVLDLVISKKWGISAIG